MVGPERRERVSQLVGWFKTAMETRQLLELLKQGDSGDAFEAAKALSKRPRLSPGQIVEILQHTNTIPNRQAAVYALAWLRGKDNHETLEALLNIFNDLTEHPAVRGQAIEGFGIQLVNKRRKVWARIETAILQGLDDESVEVRFWACYAAGTLRMKSALPRLQQLARDDSAYYPNWWCVSEEAADATEWILGRTPESRVPGRKRIESDGQA
jgi:HEAT repeat protein